MKKNNMKIVGLSICFLSFILSCKVVPKNYEIENDSTISLHEGKWISNFKNEVFLRCLKKLYPQSLSDLIDSNDVSSAANLDHLEFNTKVTHIVDSLANSFATRQEALWTIEGKKVTMNVCMKYRNSKELDSLTMLYYQRFYKK